jgi:peroxiredoxin
MKLLKDTRLKLSPLGVILLSICPAFAPQVVNRLHADDARKDAAVADADAANKQLTPAVIADGIERSMRLFETVEYSVDYTESRDVSGFGSNEPRRWIDGDGRYVYRSDGRHWFLDEHALTFNSGDAYLTPEHRISGFDGLRHFHFNSSRSVVVWGEDDLGRLRVDVPNVLWRCARSAENLLWALRNPDAKVIARPTIADHLCVVVELKWVPEWDKSQAPQRLEVTISPEQSFLPLRTIWERHGTVISECELRGLKRTADGAWYPLMIRTNRNLANPPAFPWPRTERIKSLVRRGAAAQNPFRDDELSYVPPFGIDVVDRRLGVAWHNDPWWAELAPWIKEKFDWPRCDTADLIQVESYCDPEMAGEPAPAIAADEWLNGGDPGPWNRPGRFISVVYFFGGGLIDPHPKWAAALRTWQAKFEGDGVELIGVASSGEPETIKKATMELGLKFPIAIDRKSERRGSYGQTLDAFRMQSYMGVVVVDPQGRIRLLESQRGDANPASPLDKVVLPLFAAAGRKPKWAGHEPPQPQLFQEMNTRLSDEAFRAIRAEWRRLVALRPGMAQIRGTASLAAGAADEKAPAALADVVAAPQLWLLSSNTPGGRLVDTDQARIAAVTCHADGTYLIENLRKGIYTLTFSRPRFATVERKVVLPADDSEVRIDVMLSSDAIGGLVVDADDQPLAGATVRAVVRHLAPPRRHPSTNDHLPREPITTQDDGRFLFEGLWDGAYTFEISAQGYEKATTEIVPLGTRDLKIVLQRPAGN